MMWTIPKRADVLRRIGSLNLVVRVLPLKRFRCSAIGIIVGLGSAVIAYHVVPLVGVVVSGAETVDALQVAWFPARIWAAIIVARLSGSWAHELLLQRWGRNREITEGTG